jgi:hypothetical protein
MLNGSGGTIWIGVAEDGNGTAVRVEPIPDIERARTALRDHLLATIEPAPDDSSFDIKQVEVESGEILELRVRQQGGRGPFAQLRGGARHFALRVGDRLRPMSRQEIQEAFNKGVNAGPDETRQRLADERDKILKGERSVFWICLEPTRKQGIDVQSEKVRLALSDAEQTGNRSNGWNFTNPYVTPKLGNGVVELSAGGHRVQVFRSGRISWEMPTEDLHWKGPEKTLWPWSILEYPTSLFRLAAHLYSPASTGVVLVDMLLSGIQGWRLGPYSPRDYRHDMRLHHANLVTPHDEPTISLPSPLEVRMEDLLENPDGCAFPLARQLYEAFGLREDQIPVEFDRDSHKLILSS